MIKDIKKTMNIFLGFVIVFFLFNGSSSSEIIEYFNISQNFKFIMNFIRMAIIVLIPTIYILKISPLSSKVKWKNEIGLFETIILIVFFWALYRIIVYVSMQSTLIRKIVEGSDGMFPLTKESPIIIKALILLFGVIIEELIFRGVLLNKLREHGDILAVTVSMIIFSLLHGSTFFIVVFVALFLDIVYIISNNIYATIMLHSLVNIGYMYIEDFALENNYHKILLLYGIILVICITIMLIDKKFKTTYILLKNKCKEEMRGSKEKLIAAFSSEAFICFSMIMILRTLLTYSIVLKG